MAEGTGSTKQPTLMIEIEDVLLGKRYLINAIVAPLYVGKGWTICGNPWGSDENQEPLTCDVWQPIECRCDSRDLMLHGCTCGYIKRKSWDEKTLEIEKEKRRKK